MLWAYVLQQLLNEPAGSGVMTSGKFLAASPHTKSLLNCMNAAFTVEYEVGGSVSCVKNLMSHMESQREAR